MLFDFIETMIADYTKCIKNVILYCAGKINTNKVWVAGSSYSPFQTHYADRVDFNQQDWSLIWCIWYSIL